MDHEGISMRRKLLKAGQALVLAGLTGAGSLWADELVPSGAMPPSVAANGGQVIVIEASKARAWAMQIELEFLGDPATFPYALKAQANAKGMELQGYVPNTVVRDRALALARKVCPMNVADGLIVQRNMSLPLPTMPPDNLEAMIQERLGQLEGVQTDAMHFKVGENGQVTLTGQAHALRDKLECSRGLRGLKGVTSVKNELTATDALPVLHGGGVQQAIFVQDVGPVPQYVPPALVQAQATSPVVVESTPQPQPPAMQMPMAKSPYAPKPLFGRLKSSFAKVTTNKQQQPITPSSPPSAPATENASSAQSASAAKRQVATPQAAQKSSVRNSIMPPPPVTPAKGTLSEEVAAKEAAPPASIESIETVAAKQEPPKDQGAPALVQESPAAAPSKATPAPKEAKASPAPSARAQSALKAKLKKAIGPLAREVEFKVLPEGRAEVTLHVANDANVDQVVSKMIQVPELQKYLPDDLDVKFVVDAPAGQPARQ